MSEEALAHNYAQHLAELQVGIAEVAGELGLAATTMETKAGTLGTIATDAAAIKTDVETQRTNTQRARENINESKGPLRSEAIITPGHYNIANADGAIIESRASLAIVDRQLTEAETTVDTQVTELGNIKTRLETDGATLKTHAQRWQELAEQVGRASGDAAPMF